MAEVGTVVVILLLTMLKFIAGPTLGLAAGFPLIQSIIITFVGTMMSVVLFTFLGELIREKILTRFFKKRKVFTKRNRRFVGFWNKYGMFGVAFLTPVIFTPIGGTVLMTAFGSPRFKVLTYMVISAGFWSVVMTSLVYYVSTFIDIQQYIG